MYIIKRIYNKNLKKAANDTFNQLFVKLFSIQD